MEINIKFKKETKIFYWSKDGDYILRIYNSTIGYYSTALNGLQGWFLFRKGERVL